MNNRLYVSGILAAFALTLSGCAEPPSPGAAQVISDQHTGQTSIASPKIAVQAPGRTDGLLEVTVAYNKKAGYVMFTDIGRSAWMFPKEAWSSGQRLSYNNLDSKVQYCGTSGCLTTESGAITMTRAQFQKAASSGFAFKIIGTRGSVEGNVPAAAFAGVLSKIN